MAPGFGMYTSQRRGIAGFFLIFFFQAEDGIRDLTVTGVQTCALPICAVHISPTYRANHMDSKLVLEGVRWLFSETLRIWWKDDREQVAAAIRELLQFEDRKSVV